MDGELSKYNHSAKIKFIQTEFKDTCGYFKLANETIASLEQRVESGRPVLYLTIAATYIMRNGSELHNHMVFMRAITEKCQRELDSKSQLLISN